MYMKEILLLYGKKKNTNDIGWEDIDTMLSYCYVGSTFCHYNREPNKERKNKHIEERRRQQQRSFVCYCCC